MACDTLTLPTLKVSDDNPVVNSIVDCTFSVKNTGSRQEKFHVIFRANGEQFYMSPVTTVEPGIVATVPSSFHPQITGSIDICAELICDTVVVAPTITVTSPNGGEVWYRGTPHAITWTYTGDPGAVKITRMSDGVEVGVVTESTPVGSGGSGSYTWNIAADGQTSTTSVIVVQSISQPLVKDQSNGYFSVMPVQLKPVANFTASPTSGSPTLTVQFTDTSTNNPTSWAWNFGDGGASALKNPTHPYAAGIFDVALTAGNANGNDTMTKVDYITVSSTGHCYGATCNNTGSPIGGGVGYLNIIKPDNPLIYARPASLSALQTALRDCPAGRIVFIPGSTEIDCSSVSQLLITRPGVILASDRGYNGSLGGKIKWYSGGVVNWGNFKGCITADVNNVRISGLRIEGHQFSYPGVDYYTDSTIRNAISSTGTNLEVDNCDISGWAYAGVEFSNSSGAKVHHCNIHHIVGGKGGYGYGVMVGFGDVLIEANTFDYTRHAVSGYGGAGESYEARFNIIGTRSTDTDFDVHAKGQNWANWTGIPSGRLYKIHHNTVEKSSYGYNSLYWVGFPTEGIYIDHNIFGNTVMPSNGGWTRAYMTYNYINGTLRVERQ